MTPLGYSNVDENDRIKTRSTNEPTNINGGGDGGEGRWKQKPFARKREFNFQNLASLLGMGRYETAEIDKSAEVAGQTVWAHFV